MPLYEFECDECGETVELILKVKARPPKCEECGGKLRKRVSAPAFQFKGSGWYLTDYAGKKAGGDGAKDDGAQSKGSDGKDDGSSGAGKSAGESAKSAAAKDSSGGAESSKADKSGEKAKRSKD